MTKIKLKEQIKQADKKLQASCQKIPHKSRIIIIVIFLVSCGLFSLYQVVSSFYLKSKTEQDRIPVHEVPISSDNDNEEKVNSQNNYNYGTATRE